MSITLNSLFVSMMMNISKDNHKLLNHNIGSRVYIEPYKYPKYNNIHNRKNNKYNSKTMRRNHTIKQPGIDIQRKTR